MTRKDYVMLSRAFSSAKLWCNQEQREGLYKVAEEIAHQLEKENPKFMKTVFMEACGLKTPEKV